MSDEVPCYRFHFHPISDHPTGCQGIIRLVPPAGGHDRDQLLWLGNVIGSEAVARFRSASDAETSVHLDEAFFRLGDDARLAALHKKLRAVEAQTEI